jgi:hypothetical protein
MEPSLSSTVPLQSSLAHVDRNRKVAASQSRKPTKVPSLTRWSLGLLLALCLFHAEANAQEDSGCHMVVQDLPPVDCCGTYEQPNQVCVPYSVPGGYSDFCTLGSGTCNCTGGQSYHLANTVFDEKDCGQCVVCPRTGNVQCGNPPAPL